MVFPLPMYGATLLRGTGGRQPGVDCPGGMTPGWPG